MNNIEVHSSHGTIVLDSEGFVLENNIEQYSKYKKADLKENCDFWCWCIQSDYDVLDLAWWLNDGSYQHANNETRELLRLDK